MEITSKKRNRSRSRSQHSQTSNVDEKPQKKKSKKPKEKKPEILVQQPIEPISVELSQEVKQKQEVKESSAPVPSPVTSGMSWAAIAAHNVPEPAQQIRPLLVETKSVVVEDVKNPRFGQPVSIPLTFESSESKTKKPKQKPKRKLPTDVVDFINAEKSSHQASPTTQTQKNRAARCN